MSLRNRHKKSDAYTVAVETGCQQRA